MVWFIDLKIMGMARRPWVDSFSMLARVEGRGGGGVLEEFW